MNDRMRYLAITLGFLALWCVASYFTSWWGLIPAALTIWFAWKYIQALEKARK